MSTTKAIDLQKHIREGWRVEDFIDSLSPEVERIMAGRGWRKLFRLYNLKTIHGTKHYY